MTVFCGLDQALRKSGAAILDGDRFVVAEAFTAKGVGQGGAFDEFRCWWAGFLRKHRPDWVALEEPLRSDLQRTSVKFQANDAFGKSFVKTKQPMSKHDTLLGLYGVRAIAIQVCSEMGIEYREANVRSWRSVIYGGINPPAGTSDKTGWWKNQALARCQMLGWSVPSKDAAEACLIADWMRIQLSPMGRIGGSPDMFSGAA